MKTNEKAPALPPLLPFQIAAAALKGLYVMLNAALIVPGLLLTLALTALSGYAFSAGFLNAEGGPGALLLGLGAGATLLAGVLPLARLTTKLTFRFLRAGQGWRNPNRWSRKGPVSLSQLTPFALLMFGIGIFSIGTGLGLDGLNMMLLPGTSLRLGT